MKISIKTAKKLKLYFWIPNCLIHCKGIWKCCLKNIKELEYEEVIKFLPLINKQLRRYKRHYGHITFVDITATDGTRVKIRY